MQSCMVMLVDVHAHLDHEMFAKDRDEVIARAKAAGVKVIIANGSGSRDKRFMFCILQRSMILSSQR